MGAILLMRHAEAVAESLTLRESHRYLTLEGRRQATAVARRLRDARVAVDAVLTSPLIRAAQTAELAVAALELAGLVETLPGLAPGGDAHAVAAELAARPGCVLAVGHEPALSAIGGLLCGRTAFPPLHVAQIYLVREGRPVWSLGPGDQAPVAIG